MEKKTLLVVDEDKDTRNATRFAFENELHVIEAGTLEEAIQTFDSARPDAVILEVEFQWKPSGWELLRHIREIRERTVVIVVTKNREAKTHPMRNQADGFLEKACERSDIEKLLVEKGILAASP